MKNIACSVLLVIIAVLMVLYARNIKVHPKKHKPTYQELLQRLETQEYQLKFYQENPKALPKNK